MATEDLRTVRDIFAAKYPHHYYYLVHSDISVFDSDGEVDWMRINYNLLDQEREALQHSGILEELYNIEEALVNQDDVIFTNPDNPEDRLEHYGTPRHSGRYPWGSGDNPYQRSADFLGQVDKLKKRGLSETEIAKGMNMSTTELRKRKSQANGEIYQYNIREARRLLDKGMSRSAVARRMGVNESTVRSWMNEESNERMSRVDKNASFLKDAVAKDGFIDVSAGSEEWMGLKPTSMKNALHRLEEQGYQVHPVNVDQLGTGKQTKTLILCPPGTKWGEAAQAVRDANVKMVKNVYSEDGGETVRKIEPPVSVDSKRVQIVYSEDGGDAKDGVVELRRGVDDISLKDARYAQVRIAVDGTHYIKGMAMYADDLPPGIDLRFNTNKHKGKPMIDPDNPDNSVLKPMKKKPDGTVDMENPFGAIIADDSDLIRAQRHYRDENGVEHLSALNIVREEGEWRKWNKTLASQFLSKQAPALAKKQLDEAFKDAKSEYDDIMQLDNPTVRAKMLDDFAGQCDSDAVHLAAAALPRQSTKVILPLTNTSDTEIYAPGYHDGEHVALVRYPHGGIFEIPVLTVNNNNKEAKSCIGDAMDAVGINKTVADRLSGADFDGDTVLVLPCDNVKIKATGNKRPEAYQSLEGFDPKALYPKYPGMHVMTAQEKGIEMGKVSNLITDMTIKGAPPEHICRAVKHSMVVIDAEKHKLDYKSSEKDFDIEELKRIYQNGGGVSTLISKSTHEITKNEREIKPFSFMTPDEKKRYMEGEVIYRETGKTKRGYKPDKTLLTAEERHILNKGTKSEQKKLKAKLEAEGRDDDHLTDDERHILYGGTRREKWELERKLFSEGKMLTTENGRVTKTTLGAENDPWDLVSRDSQGMTTRIESIYATYASEMKALAKKARASSRAQSDIQYNPEMAKVYSKEVKSLKDKLAKAAMNAPLERQAQMIAKKKFAAYKYEHPELIDDPEHLKREQGRQLTAARKLVGAGKLLIGESDKNPLTDREWEAISKGAVSPTMLKNILKNADGKRIRELSMPKTKAGISNAKVSQIKRMLRNGYTRQDICEALDISESTLINAVGEANV